MGFINIYGKNNFREFKTKEGKSFYKLRIPEGVEIAGKDIGGYSFTSFWAKTTTSPKGTFEASIGYSDEPLDNGEMPYVKLQKGHYDKEQETYIVDDEMKVYCEQLEQAVKDFNKDYLKNHTLFINKNYTKERESQEHGKFLSVFLPPNTIVDGKDVGGYTFTVHSQRVSDVGINEKIYSILLGDNVTLSKDLGHRDDNGEWIKGEIDKVKIGSITLKDSISKAISEYMEANKVNTEDISTEITDEEIYFVEAEDGFEFFDEEFENEEPTMNPSI